MKFLREHALDIIFAAVILILAADMHGIINVMSYKHAVNATGLTCAIWSIYLLVEGFLKLINAENKSAPAHAIVQLIASPAPFIVYLLIF